MSLVSQCVKLGVVAIFFNGPALAAPGAALKPTADIDHAATALIASGGAPAVSVAVMKDGHLLFAQAYGTENLETMTPATTQTVFRAGSITKEFVAAAILQLAQNKLLSIDDPVSNYIPELAAAQGLTLRMLLDQTSGLHDYTETPDFGAQMVQRHTQKEMIGYIASMKPLLDFAPGTKWAYSNSNYFVLGAVVQRVSGKASANILRPMLLRRRD